MARKPRVEFEGAFYHVIARGNQRQRIFVDEQDRRAYLERVERYRALHGFCVYAYVLMSNHVHMLIETQKVALSKIMQAIQFTYTQYYNRRHRIIGHLFQGRYKAILCDRDAYLLELVRYIHLNPARLRQPQDPWKYRWSSHGAYLGEKTPLAVETSPVLGQFGKGLGQARRAYMRFMEDVQKRTPRGEIEVRGRRIAFGKLLEAVAQEYGTRADVLVRGGRQRGWVKARALLVYLAREWGAVKVVELGKRLHRDPSLISRLYGFYARNRDKETEARLGRLLRRREISP